MKKNYIWNLIGWVVIVVLALLTMPNMDQLVATKGGITIPKSYQSTQANLMQKQWGSSQSHTTAVVVVFNSGHGALSSQQNAHIATTIARVKRQAKAKQIKSMMSASDGAIIANQLVSKDKSTQLLELNIAHGLTHPLKQVKTEITQLTRTPGVRTYVTGADILNSDFAAATQSGVKKTEIIAAIFIFLVLCFVFRSPVTPLFSLTTVAVSVVASVAIVANLVQYFGFPFSNFTQVFIVIVLFGIGTDYNILLYNEFRERLNRGVDRFTATREVIKVGGKTILYSGLSVFIGMSVLGFANFYRSAVGIAVGVVVLLAVLLTLNPVFMTVMGERLFWPLRPVTRRHINPNHSRLWHWMAKTAMLRPVITLIVVGLIFIPLALASHGTLNYDSLVEIGDQVPAKQGFKVVQQHFSKGISEPTTVYISSKHRLDNEQSLLLIDRVTRQLQRAGGVQTVASATQPGGEPIKRLYVNDQMSTVTSGLAQAQQGVDKINSGLKSANQQLKGYDIKGSVKQVNRLATGSQELSAGTKTLKSAIQRVTAGMNELNTKVSAATGGKRVAEIAQLQAALPKMNAAIQELSTRVETVLGGKDATRLTKLVSQLPSLNTAMQQLDHQASQKQVSTTGVSKILTQFAHHTTGLNQELKDVQTAAKSASALSNQQVGRALKDAQVQLTKKQQAALTKSLAKRSTAQQTKLQAALKAAQTKLTAETTLLKQLSPNLNTQLSNLSGITQQLKSGVHTLAQKANIILPGAQTAVKSVKSLAGQLTDATGQLSSAITTINSKLPELVSGAQQISAGNQTLAKAVAGLGKQAGKLETGIGTASNGLSRISSGTGQANTYLKGLQASAAGQTFYLPSDQLHGKTYAPVLKVYISPNHKLTKLLVVLKDNPASAAAMARLPHLENTVKGTLKGTSLGNAQVAFGGNTSSTNDTNQMASQDFLRTVIIMLTGIFLALAVVTRSLIQPMVIEGILVLAYSGALTLVHWLVKPLLGTDMLTWNTPFFTFVMVISLGVDYSIFLMMKYRENLDEPGGTESKMLDAATVIGTVVISAGIILSGTFAALMPSGVMTLIQVALSVILGIALLIILLPLVLPPVMKLTYPYPSSKVIQAAAQRLRTAGNAVVERVRNDDEASRH